MKLLHDHYTSIFYAYYGVGPYECYFCDEEVHPVWIAGPRKYRIAIHHSNGNRKDSRPENLKPSHFICHQRHHGGWGWKAGRVFKMSEEHKQKSRENMIAYNRSEKGRKKSSETMRRTHKRAGHALGT